MVVSLKRLYLYSYGCRRLGVKKKFKNNQLNQVTEKCKNTKHLERCRAYWSNQQTHWGSWVSILRKTPASVFLGGYGSLACNLLFRFIINYLKLSCNITPLILILPVIGHVDLIHIWHTRCYPSNIRQVIWRPPRKSGLTPKTFEVLEWLHKVRFSPQWFWELTHSSLWPPFYGRIWPLTIKQFSYHFKNSFGNFLLEFFFEKSIVLIIYFSSFNLMFKFWFFILYRQRLTIWIIVLEFYLCFNLIFLFYYFLDEFIIYSVIRFCEFIKQIIWILQWIIQYVLQTITNTDSIWLFTLKC